MFQLSTGGVSLGLFTHPVEHFDETEGGGEGEREPNVSDNINY